MPLTIPSEHKVALTKLASFSDEQTQRLLEALRAAAPTIWPHALAKQIATTADLPLEDVTEILDTLISLIANRDQKNFSTEKVASDVANAMAAEHIGDIQPNSAEMANVEKRLREFLEVDRSLGVTSRALNVMTQHKHPFRSGRILTDIRTVFSTGDDPQPIAGLIVHNLQIGCGSSPVEKTVLISVSIRPERNGCLCCVITLRARDVTPSERSTYRNSPN